MAARARATKVSAFIRSIVIVRNRSITQANAAANRARGTANGSTLRVKHTRDVRLDLLHRAQTVNRLQITLGVVVADQR